MKPTVSGGGPALGTVTVVVRFLDLGAACRVHGWPQVRAIGPHARSDVHSRVLTAPALVHGQVSARSSIAVQPGHGVYLIINGSDIPLGQACPGPYRRFLLRLPGITGAFRLPAYVPNGWDFFPGCVPLRRSPLVAENDIIPKMR